MLPENNKLYTGFEDSLPWQSAACDCSCLKSSLHLNGQQNVTGWCMVHYQATPPPKKKPKNKNKTTKNKQKTKIEQPNFALTSLKY